MRASFFGFLVKAKFQTKKTSIQKGPENIENQMDVMIICVSKKTYDECSACK